MRVSKKILSGILTAGLILGMSTAAFAAPSPTQGTEGEQVNQKDVKSSGGSSVNTSKAGNATLLNYNTKTAASKTSIKLGATIKVNGVKYNLVNIGAKAFRNSPNLETVTLGKNVIRVKKNAFKGNKKLKTINVTGKNAVFFVKGAFKGKKTTGVTINISKKMSKKNYKATIKQLKAIGFKGKISYKGTTVRVSI